MDSYMQAQEGPASSPSGDSPPPWLQALLQSIANMSHPSGPTSTPNSDVTKATTGVPTKQLGPLAEYDGNRDGLETWIAQAQAKIEIDYSNCSDSTKFYMLHNRLRGEAAKQLQPWVQAVVDVGEATMDGLIQQLRLSFGDPHSTEKAMRKLHRIKQSSRTFMEYFTEFRKLVLEAGGANWPDTIKNGYLEAGLSQELQNRMIGHKGPNQTFEEYCSDLKRVSDQVEAFNLRNRYFLSRKEPSDRGSYRGPPPRFENAREEQTPWRKASPPPEDMDWQPAVKIGTTRPRRAQWVDKTELDRRRGQGLCMRCGDSAHFAKDCPHLPPSKPRQVRLAKAKEGPRLEVEMDTEFNESENE
jgi:hypothetical protein